MINSGFFFWNAPGVFDRDAMFHMSLNTCNGCHGQQTNTPFLMVNPRFRGQQTFLSPFLTGTTVFDPLTGTQRTLNDLGRRRTDLTTLVCPTGDGGTPPPPPPPADGGTMPPPPPPRDAGASDAIISPPPRDAGVRF